MSGIVLLIFVEAGVASPAADRSRYPEPDAVAEAVQHALFDANPKRRYMVVPVQTEAEWTNKKAIEELVQLNQKQAHSVEESPVATVALLDQSPGLHLNSSTPG